MKTLQLDQIRIYCCTVENFLQAILQHSPQHPLFEVRGEGDTRRNVNCNLIYAHFLLAIGLSSYSPLSWSTEALPTHCKSDEVVYLNAKMFSETKGEIGNDTGKMLSLCAGQGKEPFGKFVYRYGAIGNVEMERVASTLEKFGLSSQSDEGSHAGEVSISFKHGKYTYVVSEAMGMASFGVRLYVYESKKPILTLSSAQQFERSVVSINIDKASSQIFKLVKPIAPW